MKVSSLTEEPRRRVRLDRCVRAGEISLTTFSFSIIVSLTTSTGEEPRRDLLRDRERCLLGEGPRTDKPSQFWTDLGASANGTVLISSNFSVVLISSKTPPCTLGALMEGAIDAGGASRRRVVTAFITSVFVALGIRSSGNSLTLFLPVIFAQREDFINVIGAQCLFDNDCSFVLRK